MLSYLKVTLHALFSIHCWLGYLAIMAAPLWLAGIPICYALARSGKYAERDSLYYGKRVLAWTPRWAWIWGNEEDGVGGTTWWDARVKGAFSWREIFLWSALRNPANNLRFVPVLHPVPEPKRVRYAGNSIDPWDDLKALREEGDGLHRPYWCYAWQGLFAGFYVIWPLTMTRHFRLRVGWKILPKDAIGGTVTDYRRFRYPFGLQFTPWRKG